MSTAYTLTSLNPQRALDSYTSAVNKFSFPIEADSYPLQGTSIHSVMILSYEIQNIFSEGARAIAQDFFSDGDFLTRRRSLRAPRTRRSLRLGLFGSGVAGLGTTDSRLRTRWRRRFTDPGAFQNSSKPQASSLKPLRSRSGLQRVARFRSGLGTKTKHTPRTLP